ncbi:MAG: sel1 repeat family protein [Asticcacaulis sp.]|nr:sel1 repeat family protein [Asticcacaulis sp.]
MKPAFYAALLFTLSLVPAAGSQSAELTKRARLLADAEAGKNRAVEDIGFEYEHGSYEDHTKYIMQAYDLYARTVDKSNYAREKMCVALLAGDPLPKDEMAGLTLCAHTDFGSASSHEDSFVQAYKDEHGIGRAPDPAKAYKTYEYLADKFAPAATVVGDEAYGLGDLARARSLYAANAVFSLGSLVRLARMVEAGEGGPQDRQEAAWLYAVAAQEGSPAAAAWLKQQPDAVTALVHVNPVLDHHDLAIKRSFTWKGSAATDVYVAGTLPLYLPPKGRDEFDDIHMEITCYVNAAHRIDLCLTTGAIDMNIYSSALRDAYSGDIVVPDVDADGKATANTLYMRRICSGFHCG